MITIPNVTSSKYFGKISKAVWYQVVNEYNPYFLSFNIDLLPNQALTINVMNRFQTLSNPEYSRIFPASNTGRLNTIIELYHIPTYKSPFYAVLNS